jgi:murein DD-endopeptidase MepM/ murein hydrolase activator NlpD
MRNKLENLGLRLLLLLTKGFVYLWQAALKPLWQRLKKPLLIYGEWVIYIILITLTPVYSLYRRVKRLILELKLSPAPLLKLLVHRYSLHSLIIFLACLTVYSNVTFSQAAINEQTADPLILSLIEQEVPDEPLDLPTPESEDPNETGGGGIDDDAISPLLSYDGESAYQPYLPSTGTSSAPRQGLEEYLVEEGDTLAAIAAKFRIKLETILSTNGLSARALIQPGQKLSILPVDGLLHTVKRGETIKALATRYSVSAESILSFNRITDDRSIVIGQILVIPGGKAPVAVAPRAPAASNPSLRGPATPPVDAGAKLLWPTSSRRINQYYTWRHNGLDIDGDTGSPIYAAESGTVLTAGWQSGYGNTLLIHHDNGLITRYGHHSKNLVRKGERVDRGQLIALMGSTGRSTGPHLHFEVIVGAKRVNPFIYAK